MDYIRAILDGIAIAAIFNGAVAVLVLINPRYFFDSYPKAIQKAAPEQMTKKEKNINFIITIVICGICFIYSIASLIHTGISGFWNLFLDGVHSVEHIELRRFLFAGLSVIPRKT